MKAQAKDELKLYQHPQVSVANSKVLSVKVKGDLNDANRIDNEPRELVYKKYIYRQFIINVKKKVQQE